MQVQERSSNISPTELLAWGHPPPTPSPTLKTAEIQNIFRLSFKCAYFYLAKIWNYLFFINFFFNIYLWEAGQDRTWVGKGQRVGADTESKAGSRLWGVSTEPDAGLELTDCEIMIWAEVGRVTDWATQAPLELPFLIWMSCEDKYQLSNWMGQERVEMKQINHRVSFRDAQHPKLLGWGVGGGGWG